MLKLSSSLRAAALVHHTRTQFTVSVGSARCLEVHSSATSGTRFASADKCVQLTSGSTFYNQESDNLKARFRSVVMDLTGMYEDIHEAATSLEKLLLYNVPGGKLYRVMSFLHTFTQLHLEVHVPDEVTRLKYIMGICLELFQSSCVMLDDLVDESSLRRGKPCWYILKTSDRHTAINDVSMMRSSLFILLQRHFSNQLYYPCLLRLFHQVLYRIILGQVLDLKTHSSDGKPMLELFTMDRYRTLAQYKTGFYTFCFPVMVALTMSEYCDDDMKQLEDILIEMGIFYQIQNDYWDCYEEVGLTGKYSNDVKEGKCTWLAAVALQSASASQRALFQECYGQDSCSCTSVIMDLYEELEVSNKFKNYEQDTYNKFWTQISQMPSTIPRHVLFSILGMLFRKTY